MPVETKQNAHFGFEIFIANWRNKYRKYNSVTKEVNIGVQNCFSGNYLPLFPEVNIFSFSPRRSLFAENDYFDCPSCKRKLESNRNAMVCPYCGNSKIISKDINFSKNII